ncbi:hypothetical protein BN2476_210148 [Paraburkholderia piptadeniae]|uniref:Uncharacterized protein n=1 Tax=Paraburkholderia piptadeniae TaxID=1701573 RepID=A0A1N7RW77_9BURK|nr:hypothetical protein BN2476_210148 [Paraburkholderia piptadeniae]
MAATALADTEDILVQQTETAVRLISFHQNQVTDGHERSGVDPAMMRLSSSPRVCPIVLRGSTFPA